MKIQVTPEWQMIVTTIVRKRRVLSILPFIVVTGFGTDFHWTGKWFKFVTIEEVKVKNRHSQFDDGWSYQNYWGKWKTSWVLTKIIL
jgi:hypothetical protein